MKKGILERIKEGDVILADGAIGTMLYDRGVFFNRCFDEINITNPELIQSIHKEYLDAGAEILTTNTFGGTVPRLKGFGLAEQIVAINTRAVEIIKEVAEKAGKGNDIYIAGSIGPLGLKIEPLGPLANEEAIAFFRQQAEILCKAGVDFFALETFVDLNELHQAIIAIKQICDKPVSASVTVRMDGTSLYGTDPDVFTQMIDRWGADIIGLNCSEGPRSMMEALEKMVTLTTKPLNLQPNAGIPHSVAGRNFYLCTPEYMAEYAKRFIQKGASIIGGCCGTTPAHIKQMRKSIRSLQPGRVFRESITVVETEEKSVKPKPLETKSHFGYKLHHNHFVTTVELLPPRGVDPGKVIESAKLFEAKGIDAINIPDGPRASTRISALSTALLIHKELANIETILHYTCRDRNLLGIQSDLLGAYTLGIRNLLLITGDPPKMGRYPDATAVFDVDSIGLCNIVNSFNHGYDLGKNFIGEAVGLCYGVGVNPGSDTFEEELKRFWWKVDAGAEYAITQPIFDVNQFFEFLERIKEFPKIPIIAGIWPLISFRNAEFMKNEVPGVNIPDSILRRMEQCESKEEGREEGIRIAKELFDQIRGYISGIQVSVPMGNVEHTMKVLEFI